MQYSKRIRLNNYLSELELEVALSVEDLDAVVVGVGDDDVVLRVDCHSRRLRELPFEHAELAELRGAKQEQLFSLQCVLNA